MGADTRDFTNYPYNFKGYLDPRLRRLLRIDAVRQGPRTRIDAVLDRILWTHYAAEADEEELVGTTKDD